MLAMLRALGCRGPDSAGVAIFGPPGEAGLRIRAPEGADTDDIIAGLQSIGVAPYRHYRNGVIDALPAKGEIPQFIEQEIEEEEAESEDDPYQESDEALPDDAEERVINRNPSREGGAFDEV